MNTSWPTLSAKAARRVGVYRDDKVDRDLIKAEATGFNES